MSYTPPTLYYISILEIVPSVLTEACSDDPLARDLAAATGNRMAKQRLPFRQIAENIAICFFLVQNESYRKSREVFQMFYSFCVFFVLYRLTSAELHYGVSFSYYYLSIL